MNARLRMLNDQRLAAFTRCRELTTKADAEKRVMNTEEQSEFDKSFKAQDELRADIQREVSLAEAELEARQLVIKASEGNQGEQTGGEGRKHLSEEQERRAQVFGRYLRSGKDALSSDEYRALKAADDTAGGSLVPPEEFIKKLIQAVDNEVFMRQKATVMTVKRAKSGFMPTLDADPDDADWTTELSTGSADSAMKTGGRRLNPTKLAKRIKVSRELIEMSEMSVEDLVRQRLAYKFAVTMEKAAMTGSGASRYLGIFTASANGISTSRDTAGTNTTTAVTAASFIDCKYNVKQQYQRRGEWVMHRDVMKATLKLADSTGQFLWQPSLQAGQPDRLLGSVVNQSEYAPNTFTAGLYMAVFGDLKEYNIIDSLEFGIQRLDELYAETDEVGFIGRAKSDGAPVLQEAFSRMKLAA